MYVICMYCMYLYVYVQCIERRYVGMHTGPCLMTNLMRPFELIGILNASGERKIKFHGEVNILVASLTAI